MSGSREPSLYEPEPTSRHVSVNVRIPTALRSYAGHEAKTQVQAKTVGEALQALVARHPALRPHLYEDDGRLRSFVNVYLGERDIRELSGLDTSVAEGDALVIVPSVAGGSLSLAKVARRRLGDPVTRRAPADARSAPRTPCRGLAKSHSRGVRT